MRQALAFLAVPLVAFAAGCGSSNDKSGDSGSTPASTPTPAPASAAGGGGTTVKIEADEDGKLYFQQRKATAKAGKVTLRMENPKSSGVAHGIGIEGQGVDKDGQIVPPGQDSTISVTLKPGTYEYYCPIPSHKQAGMKGTLTVQ